MFKFMQKTIELQSVFTRFCLDLFGKTCLGFFVFHCESKTGLSDQVPALCSVCNLHFVFHFSIIYMNSCYFKIFLAWSCFFRLDITDTVSTVAKWWMFLNTKKTFKGNTQMADMATSHVNKLQKLMKLLCRKWSIPYLSYRSSDLFVEFFWLCELNATKERHWWQRGHPPLDPRSHPQHPHRKV